jgi:hypothetical protein
MRERLGGKSFDHLVSVQQCRLRDGDAEGFGGSDQELSVPDQTLCPSQSNLPESLTVNDCPVSKAHAALYWRLTLQFSGGALPYVLWHFIHHRPLQPVVMRTT